MGLVKKLLGGTLAFLGGIFGFLGGLIGLGKKSEYFMEMEEAKEETAATLPAASPAKAAAPAQPAPAAKAEPKVEPKVEPPVQPVSAAPPAKAEAAKPAAKAEAPAPKPKVQVAKIENGKVEQLSESAPAAVPVGVVQPSAEQTFAPKYLVGMSTNGRRRPGPSLNYFRDMAKQVKTN
ncbi:hypothetical protein H6F67_05405 [Microcoleus sp. FACHB-1515]|uniref:hypothetical protein n=1 Tax=Cyanophyceae TaxID=3028117 RepID=UPI001688AAB8|nr:hypothetical protein [Microcoleus sp. FACHB-1515]MBD2089287.1 hypothetical protein [Microcoleus sp. FACHB-1515]